MKNHYSPLRYPGGKGKLVPFVKEIFRKNNLIGGYYAEPFVGGGSVALSLLLDEYVNRIIINDLDRSIFAFWHSVIYETEKLCRMIKDSRVTVSNWHKQKLVQKNKNKCSLIDLGFSTFFLNRTNRSGILNAGIIGGINQNGNYKMDVRFNKKDLIERINHIAMYRSRIELYNLDAEVFITSLINNNTLNPLLLFLDPPYYKSGQELYFSFYNHEDHLSLSRLVLKIKDKSWIVTYDDSNEIRNLYNQTNMHGYYLNYTANKVKKGKELLFYSSSLSIPSSLLNLV